MIKKNESTLQQTNIFLGSPYLIKKHAIKYFKGCAAKQMMKVFLEGIPAKMDELCIYQSKTTSLLINNFYGTITQSLNEAKEVLLLS